MRLAVRRFVVTVFSLACLLVLVPAVASASSGANDVYYRTISTAGTVGSPSGVAVDSSGNVYVSDSASLFGDVSEFDAAGDPTRTIGSGGCPSDVAVDDPGNVYVADPCGYQGVEKFDPSGNPLQTFGQGQVCNPSGVAVDGSANVWISDDCYNGLLRLDASGNGTGWFAGCQGNDGHAAVDGSGNLFIADQDWCWGTGVDEFDSSGNYLQTISSGQLPCPTSVALDGSGDIYALDTCNNDVVEFDPSGNYVQTIGSGKLQCPNALVVGSGDVYVLDPCQSGVLEFGLAGPPASLTVSPTSSSVVAGSTDTVTATVTDSAGRPVYDASVDFGVDGGGPGGVRSTDRTGQASFSYTTSSQAGSETVKAFVDLSGDGTDDSGDPSASTAITLTPSATGDGPVYSSCAQVAAQNPGAADGTYTIRVAGAPTQVYCRGLSGQGPQAYLVLNNTNGANYSMWNDPRFYTKTVFTKVRVVANGDVVGGVTCTAAACIDTTDFTYSTSTGGSQFGPDVAYANAPGCGYLNGYPNGTANVDLTGTPLAVAPNAFQSSGFWNYGDATYSDSGQVVDLWGNGWCGGEGPVDAPLLPLYPVGGVQTISFPSTPTNPTYGQVQVDPGATASSGLPVTYRASGACTVDSAGLLDFTAAGQCTVTANQPGDGSSFVAAYPASETFTVAKAPLMINAEPATMTYGGSPPSLGSTLSGFVNGDNVFTAGITGIAACTAPAPTPPLDVVAGGYPGAITCSPGTLQAPNYAFVSGTSATLTVTQATQSISISAAPATLGAGNVKPASASSGLPVSYASHTPTVCAPSSDGQAIVLLADGTCTVTASQAGNADYQAATPVQGSFVVGTAPVITSSAAARFITGTAGAATIVATGYPAPSISESGALPAGLTLIDNGNGSATLSGTPTSGSGGVYPITVTASNVVKPDATQSYTLTVDAPTTTSLAASPDPANVGQAVTYRASVSAAPTANAGTVTFSDNGATIPGCIAVAVTSGQALCHVQYAATGSHTIGATFNPGGIWLGSAATAVGETVSNCGASLQGCNLQGGNLAGANLAGLNLSGDNLTGVNLQGANLQGANLAGANLKGATITGADLAGANLSGDNLKGDSLRNANLAGANLQGVNLQGADLTGASLHSATTTGANLQTITWSNTVCPDGTNSTNDQGTCTNNL